MDCDVLICGLGPVGQLLALLLERHGVSTIAVDQAVGPYPLPRAAVTDDEVLRIFQSVGLADAILADAQVMDGVSFVTAAGRRITVLDTMTGAVGHPPLVSLHQPTMERTMVAALADRGIELRWSTVLESFDQHASGVTAYTRPVGGGRSEPITARYLVGCDGASSAVRARLQIPFAGSTFAQRWLVVDAQVDRPLAQVPHPHFVGHAERPIVTLPMSPGRHRWEWMIHPGEDEAAFLDPAAIDRRIAAWTSPGERVAVERAVIYTFHARAAARWRSGRVFLAGDAAHVMPPFAGQGFSSGARDAQNLAWKLAAVLDGAPVNLLDSYEQERRPHVTAMQNVAVRWGGVVQTTQPRKARLRDGVMSRFDGSKAFDLLRKNAKPLPTYGHGVFARRPHVLPPRRTVGSLFPQPRLDGTLLDDLLPPGWATVTAEHDPDGWLARRGLTWAILRPDRFVFACGATDDELRAAEHARDAVLGPALVTA